MKRWEMVAKAFVIDEEAARLECTRWYIDPDTEMDALPAPATAPDLGRDIAAAHIVVAAKGDDEWCDALMAKWTRLTGRAKEGE